MTDETGDQLQHSISDEEFHRLNKPAGAKETIKQRCQRCRKPGPCMWGGFIGECPLLPEPADAELEKASEIQATYSADEIRAYCDRLSTRQSIGGARRRLLDAGKQIDRLADKLRTETFDRKVAYSVADKLARRIDELIDQIKAKDEALQRITNWRKNELYKEDIGKIAEQALKGKKP